MILAETSCAEVLGSVADWLAMLATWVAAIAAVVAGYFAYHAYQAQENQVELLQRQATENREKENQENQLKRFRHGPYFIHERHTIPIEAKAWAQGMRGILLLDRRGCSIDRIITRRVDRDHATAITRYRNITDAGGGKYWKLLFIATDSEWSEHATLTFEIFFSTADGFEDIHTYEHKLRTLIWRRTDPAQVQLHGQESWI